MILVYSGTGNSFWVADRLAQDLDCDELIIRLEHKVLLSGLLPDLDEEKLRQGNIVWVFPVYSWGIPPVVVDFIKRLDFKFPSGSSHHLVVTCGDDIGDLANQWYALLDKKGWKRGAVWSVQMPNTYTLMKGFDVDPDSLEREKILNAIPRISEIAARLNNGLPESLVDVVKGKYPWIKSKIIYPWFVRFEMSPRPFRADSRCISCGLCEEQCPTENIHLKPENDVAARPVWGDNCALCLRCYHHCPANAIQYGSRTKNKGQYKISKLLKTLSEN